MFTNTVLAATQFRAYVALRGTTEDYATERAVFFEYSGRTRVRPCVRPCVRRRLCYQYMYSLSTLKYYLKFSTKFGTVVEHMY